MIDTTHLDSEDDYRTGCGSVSHCQQQSYSGLRSPGRSNSTYFWTVTLFTLLGESKEVTRQSHAKGDASARGPRSLARSLVSPKRHWKQWLCKILVAHQRALWYFFKKVYWRACSQAIFAQVKNSKLSNESPGVRVRTPFAPKSHCYSTHVVSLMVSFSSL